ncbi:MAG TPA: hypothetical protein VMD75_11075 [Candidatus Binataceae bacterium]|nr:hypothetical protein [Candidatus Binataceae bacterium]
MDGHRCKAVKPDGHPCRANPQESKDCCFFHDPDKAYERRAAQARGGQGNSTPSPPIDPPDFATENAADVIPLLVDTIKRLYRRELTPSVGTTISSLAKCLIRALDDRETQQRLCRLEQQLSETKIKEGLFDPNTE